MWIFVSAGAGDPFSRYVRFNLSVQFRVTDGRIACHSAAPHLHCFSHQSSPAASYRMEVVFISPIQDLLDILSQSVSAEDIGCQSGTVACCALLNAVYMFSALCHQAPWLQG